MSIDVGERCFWRGPTWLQVLCYCFKISLLFLSSYAFSFSYAVLVCSYQNNKLLVSWSTATCRYLLMHLYAPTCNMSCQISILIFRQLSTRCCGSEIKFSFFLSGSGSFFGLNFGSGFESGSGLYMKNTLEIQII